MSQTDHIRIDFTSDVPEVERLMIIARVRYYEDPILNPDIELHQYEHFDTTTGQLVIEITAHNRDTFDLTDGQVVERLRATAKSQGLSVKELLRRLATE
jgi:hypothetical protein